MRAFLCLAGFLRLSGRTRSTGGWPEASRARLRASFAAVYLRWCLFFATRYARYALAEACGSRIFYYCTFLSVTQPKNQFIEDAPDQAAGNKPPRFRYAIRITPTTNHTGHNDWPYRVSRQKTATVQKEEPKLRLAQNRLLLCEHRCASRP